MNHGPDFINLDDSLDPEYNCVSSFLFRRILEESWRERNFILTEQGRALTYGAVIDETERLSSYFSHRMGLRKGDRVLLHGYNSPELVIAWLAIVRIGAVIVTSMPILREPELSEYIRLAEIDGVVWDARTPAVLERVRCAVPKERIRRFRSGGDQDLFEQARRHPVLPTPVSTGPDDPCLIAFTSGTTGSPKAIVHRHRDIQSICDRFCAMVLQPRPDDLFLGSPPIGFTYGLGAQILFPASAGAAVLLLEHGSAENLGRAIDRFRPSILFSSPQAYRAILASSTPPDPTSLRLCVSAGEVLPRDIHAEWRRRTGVNIINGIGSTEMLHIFIALAPDRIKDGSVGRPTPGYEARILDDAGDECPVGAAGHLAVRGPTGCRYLNAAAPARSVRNGWNFTGDLASMDRDGDVFIHGRTDDLINFNGFKVDPVMVENAIAAHPAVEACAVVGLPDEQGRQIVCAFVVTNRPMTDADLSRTLTAHLRDRLASYRIPKRFTAIDALPTTASGKIRRHVLRTPAHAL